MKQSLTLHHRPEGADQFPPPSITLLTPNPDQRLNRSTFRLAGEINSVGGAVTLLINGKAVELIGDEEHRQALFDEQIEIPNDDNTLTQYTATLWV